MQFLFRGARTLSVLLLAISAKGLTPPDFTGHWRQQTESGAQRQLDIDQNGQTLQVKTTVINSKGARQLEVSMRSADRRPATKVSTGMNSDRRSIGRAAPWFSTQWSVRVGEKSPRQQSGLCQRTAIIFR
jgi:hypothetical protein